MVETDQKRFLCVLGVARSGVSYLSWLLASFPEINAKVELFHSKALPAFSIRERDALVARSGMDISDKAAFAAWRREHPGAALEAIQEGAKSRRAVAFKLLPGYLHSRVIESDLIARDDVAFLIVRRRPIDCFISVVKQRAAGAQRDTTEIKPEISVDSFVEWAKRSWRWYRWCEETLEAREKPFVRISYERYLNREPVAAIVPDLIELLEPLELGPLSEPANLFAPARQDREPRYQDRVTNWTAFESQALVDPMAAKLLDWAERAR